MGQHSNKFNKCLSEVGYF